MAGLDKGVANECVFALDSATGSEALEGLRNKKIFVAQREHFPKFSGITGCEESRTFQFRFLGHGHMSLPPRQGTENLGLERAKFLATFSTQFHHGLEFVFRKRVFFGSALDLDDF